jgi:hypothetical protein
MDAVGAVREYYAQSWNLKLLIATSDSAKALETDCLIIPFYSKWEFCEDNYSIMRVLPVVDVL